MLHEYCQNYLLILRTLPFPDVHEATCSLVMWYSKGTCDSLELGIIKKKGGQYVE